MNLKKTIPTTFLALVLSLGASLLAQTKGGPKTDAEIIAQARAGYPLKTCVVSGEPLGSMGEATAYIHRAAGQPDRVVFFCCDGCIDDFKADPAKFLKKVDDAAGGQPAKGKKKKAGGQSAKQN